MAKKIIFSGAPRVRRIGYFCIQEILVLTVKSSVRVLPPAHVSGCEMSHLLAESPGKACTLSALKLGNRHPCYSQLTVVKKGIHWPVSHDCIAGSGIQFIEVTTLVFN